MDICNKLSSRIVKVDRAMEREGPHSSHFPGKKRHCVLATQLRMSRQRSKRNRVPNLSSRERKISCPFRHDRKCEGQDPREAGSQTCPLGKERFCALATQLRMSRRRSKRNRVPNLSSRERQISCPFRHDRKCEGQDPREAGSQTCPLGKERYCALATQLRMSRRRSRRSRVPNLPSRERKISCPFRHDRER